MQKRLYSWSERDSALISAWQKKFTSFDSSPRPKRRSRSSWTGWCPKDGWIGSSTNTNTRVWQMGRGLRPVRGMPKSLKLAVAWWSIGWRCWLCFKKKRKNMKNVLLDMLEECCTANAPPCWYSNAQVTDERYTRNLPAQEVSEVATWQLYDLFLMHTFRVCKRPNTHLLWVDSRLSETTSW